jgi:threonine dehydrogenase-like Zn-dependent dehydrogenase
MRGAVLHAPGDVRVEEATACVCGSDLWPYRGIEKIDGPAPMGHEYVGIFEEVGDEVANVKPGQFVVGSFFASDNTCEICQAGYQSSCTNREPMGALGAQAEYLRVPLAHGTLVATSGLPADDLVPSLLAASDVLGTGWFAVAAQAGLGKTVAVVGDGAVGLLGVLAAKQLGAERIIAMSRHESRQKLATEFGATDIVTERGDDGVARIKELTGGLGAHSVIEAVGTQESMMQAIRATRPGGHVGYVGVAHDVQLLGEELFFSHVHLHGGPAPVRRYLPELIDLVWNRQINPGKVFDLELPLDQAAVGYKAMASDAPSKPSSVPDTPHSTTRIHCIADATCDRLIDAPGGLLFCSSNMHGRTCWRLLRATPGYPLAPNEQPAGVLLHLQGVPAPPSGGGHRDDGCETSGSIKPTPKRPPTDGQHLAPGVRM